MNRTIKTLISLLISSAEEVSYLVDPVSDMEDMVCVLEGEGYMVTPTRYCMEPLFLSGRKKISFWVSDLYMKILAE